MVRSEGGGCEGRESGLLPKVQQCSWMEIRTYILEIHIMFVSKTGESMEGGCRLQKCTSVPCFSETTDSSSHSIDSQEEEWRQSAVRWVMTSTRRVGVDTHYLALMYFNRLVEKQGNSLSSQDYEKVAVVSLLLATKMNQIYPPKITSLLARCRTKFTKEEVIQMEGACLLAMDFDFATLSTPYYHLLHLLAPTRLDKLEECERLLKMIVPFKDVFVMGNETLAYAIANLIVPQLIKDLKLADYPRIKVLTIRVYNIFLFLKGRQNKENLTIHPLHLTLFMPNQCKITDYCRILQEIYYYSSMYENLNVVGLHPHIPLSAFLFMPKRNPPKDDYCIGEDKSMRRLLFEGWAQDTYSAFEKQKLEELAAYLARKNITIDPRWNNSWRMRFMQSTGYNVKNCINDMGLFITYLDSNVDPQFTPNVQRVLNGGLFYIAGRDCHYRPILVFDIQKLLDSALKESQILEAQIYFFQYVLRNMLIPGQVENWVAIIDCNDASLFSLFGCMKDFISFLSNTYRCRMFVAYVVHCPYSIQIGWSIAKRFLQEQTIKKMNFFDDKLIPVLLEHCHPSQVERKYGGTCPNLTSFWPPKEVSPEYTVALHPVESLAPNKYYSLYKDKVLRQTKSHEDLIFPSLQSKTAAQAEGTHQNSSFIHKIQTRLHDLDQQYRHSLLTQPPKPLSNKIQPPPKLHPLPSFEETFFGHLTLT